MSRSVTQTVPFSVPSVSTLRLLLNSFPDKCLLIHLNSLRYSLPLRRSFGRRHPSTRVGTRLPRSVPGAHWPRTTPRRHPSRRDASTDTDLPTPVSGSPHTRPLLTPFATDERERTKEGQRVTDFVGFRTPVPQSGPLCPNYTVRGLPSHVPDFRVALISRVLPSLRVSPTRYPGVSSSTLHRLGPRLDSDYLDENW